MQSISDALDLLTPGWVGSIIGLLGLGAAVVTYFLTRQRKVLAFNYFGKRLLGLSGVGLPVEINVSYQGQNIPRLTRTLVLIWNAGEKTILSEDIIKTDPLRLRFKEDGQVLAATVLKCTRNVNQVITALSEQVPNEVVLSFSFLDTGDGAVVEVLHTSERRSVEVLGTIRGLPKGFVNFGRILGKDFPARSFAVASSPRKIAWVATSIGVFAVLAGIVTPWEYLDKLDKTELRAGWVIIGAGSLYAILGVTLLFLSRRRYPKVLHIDELG